MERSWLMRKREAISLIVSAVCNKKQKKKFAYQQSENSSKTRCRALLGNPLHSVNRPEERASQSALTDRTQLDPRVTCISEGLLSRAGVTTATMTVPNFWTPHVCALCIQHFYFICMPSNMIQIYCVTSIVWKM